MYTKSKVHWTRFSKSPSKSYKIVDRQIMHFNSMEVIKLNKPAKFADLLVVVLFCIRLPASGQRAVIAQPSCSLLLLLLLLLSALLVLLLAVALLLLLLANAALEDGGHLGRRLGRLPLGHCNEVVDACVETLAQDAVADGFVFDRCVLWVRARRPRVERVAVAVATRVEPRKVVRCVFLHRLLLAVLCPVG